MAQYQVGNGSSNKPDEPYLGDLEFDVIILGSGLCGTKVNALLSDKYRVLMINTISNNSGGSFDFRSKQGVFSPEQAQKGLSLRGRGTIDHWGGAITWPTKENYFLEAKDPYWISLHNFIENHGLNSIFGLKKLRKSWLNFDMPKFVNSALTGEANGYLGGSRFSSLAATNQIFKKHEFVSCVVHEIESNEGFKLEIETMGVNQRKTVKSKYLVLAAGPLLSPLFYSMISGQRNFEYGNHISFSSHELEFNYPLVVGSWAQTYSKKEESFYTYHQKIHKSDKNRVSIRFRPVNQVSKRMLVKQLFSKKTEISGSKIQTMKCLSFSFLRRIQISNIFTIDFMVNQEPNECSRLSIEDSQNGKIISVTSVLSSEIKELLKTQMLNLDSLLATEMRENSELQIRKLFDLEDLDSGEKFRDAAHWYGTLARSGLESRLSEHSESLDFPNLFVSGAAGFLEGSIGHPTLLGLFTSCKVAEEINKRELK